MHSSNPGRQVRGYLFLKGQALQKCKTGERLNIYLSFIMADRGEKKLRYATRKWFPKILYKVKRAHGTGNGVNAVFLAIVCSN